MTNVVLDLVDSAGRAIAGSITFTPTYDGIPNGPPYDATPIEADLVDPPETATLLPSSEVGPYEVRARRSLGGGIVFSGLLNIPEAGNYSLNALLNLRKAAVADTKQFVSSVNGLTGDVTLESGGDSAYEVAVQNGFEGTESAWLQSLRGENGQGVQPQRTLTVSDRTLNLTSHSVATASVAASIEIVLSNPIVGKRYSIYVQNTGSSPISWTFSGTTVLWASGVTFNHVLPPGEWRQLELQGTPSSTVTVLSARAN
jgi:hypothetical protein